MRKFAFLALLIIAGPIQAQLAYICAMPTEMACCEGHGLGMIVSPDCDMPHEGGPADCMELADTDADGQAARTASTSPDRAVEKAPPIFAALPPPTFELSPAGASSLVLIPSFAPPGAAGTRTYLVTRRLRI